MPRPAITPAPPMADGVGLPWDVPVDDAVQVIAEARARHGDTFVVESGRDVVLFTFSATGVESFYALPEDVASKGVADYLMLRRKLPDEIFEDRRMLPGSLFGKDDVASYLGHLDQALHDTSAELGDHGEIDVFALTRRLGHRMGLASWAGPVAHDPTLFPRLVTAFDVLDGADAFVHPDAMVAVAASGKADERAALEEVVAIVGSSVPAETPVGDGLFERIVRQWDGEPDEQRRRGVALDVALIHIASLSNLGAALAWALADLIAHPGERDRVLAGDDDLAVRCVLESTRLAQRSIMSRTVLQSVAFDVGDAVHEVAPGATIATLLPLTNRDPVLGHDAWDPSRWTRHRFTDTDRLASPLLVTAFGHGRHTCPAQLFSIRAMTAAVRHLFGSYVLEPVWTVEPRPVPAQIGGIARAADACPVRFRLRS